MCGIHPLIVKCFKSAHIDAEALSAGAGNVVQDGAGKKYYARTSRDIAQVTGEYQSLCALAKSAPQGFIPRVIGFSVDDTTGAMVTEYLEMGGRKDASVQKELGKKLAEMHSDTKASGGRFGFEVPTHCGITEQDNTWETDWTTFYRDRRLGELVRRIGDPQVSEAWGRMVQTLIPLLLDDIEPRPKPVIIHGDLWSGNVGVARHTGSPVIFDPSSCYGHNEYELGICNMFGGFTADFFDAYHAIHPRCEPFYNERQSLYELYHHLNHFLMFGGGYKSGVLRIMNLLLDFAEAREGEGQGITGR